MDSPARMGTSASQPRPGAAPARCPGRSSGWKFLRFSRLGLSSEAVKRGLPETLPRPARS